MAIHAPITGAPTRASFKIALNLSQLAAADLILELFGRENMELAIETLIERLDAADGDPELEADGDLLDGCRSEDDFGDFPAGLNGEWFGPGCPISDPGEPIGDEEDHNFTEDDFCEHYGSYGPGCPVSDPGGFDGYHEQQEDDEPDAPEARKHHLARIRRDVCRRTETLFCGGRTAAFTLPH